MTVNIDVLDTQHSNLDENFRRHAFNHLRGSGAVRVVDLVATSPSGANSAKRTLDVLVERGMAIIEDDRLVAIDGLSIQPTKHRMRLGEDPLFTWCAADAVGIPAALGEDGEVVTACPQCSAEIVVAIRAGEPHGDSDLVLWLPTASCSHVVTQFCPDVNFFCSRDHLDAWRSQAGNREGETLSAHGAAELGLAMVGIPGSEDLNMTQKEITLRYFDGCPNWMVAKERLEEALMQMGETRALRLERVETAQEADELNFPGSPTILIDGHDPFTDPDAPTGLSCRVYRTEAGMEGSPSLDQLVAALTECHEEAAVAGRVGLRPCCDKRRHRLEERVRLPNVGANSLGLRHFRWVLPLRHNSASPDWKKSMQS